MSERLPYRAFLEAKALTAPASGIAVHPQDLNPRLRPVTKAVVPWLLSHTPGAGLRYLSVCSGIEVAALAWVPLGWQPVLVSEIEAFPCEVLRIRHGAWDARRTRPADSLALWGDFSALRMRSLRRLGIDPADIDVLVGGTPCQGFSVAGLRGSLSDPRGGLSLAFLRLAHAIQSVRARAGRPGLVVVWENVPGVLNTPDNALGCFLGALVGADDALRSPLERGRWPSAGMVSGPRGRAAWRVLDAQHFGLAQRRERVFLVAGLGDGPDPAGILFELQGLHGDPAPGGEAAEDVAATLAGGARSGGGYSADDIPLVAGTLRSHTRPGSNEVGSVVAHPLRAQRNASHRPDSDAYAPVTVGTLAAHGARARGAGLNPETLVAFGGNRQSGPLEVATAVNAHGGPHGRLDFETETFIVTPFDPTQITSPTNRSNPQPGDPCHPLAAQGHPPAIAFDCKAGGETGFAIGDLPGALRGDGAGGGHAAIAYDLRNASGGEVTMSLQAGGMGSERGLCPNAIPHTVTMSGVRRLMPVECERLQGVPDHFTRIPWRGRPAEECPDGPRYRALGNAYPRPVLAWIGQRIMAAHPACFFPAAAE